MVTAQLGSHAGQWLLHGQHSSAAAGWQPIQGSLSIFFLSNHFLQSLSLPGSTSCLISKSCFSHPAGPHWLSAGSSLTAPLSAGGTLGCRTPGADTVQGLTKAGARRRWGMNRNQPSFAHASLTPRAQPEVRSGESLSPAGEARSGCWLEGIPCACPILS